MHSMARLFGATLSTCARNLPSCSASARYGDLEVLRDVTWSIGPGERTGILGANGSGKSTLLRIMSGFVRQTEGRVLFDGQPVDHLSPSQRGVGRGLTTSNPAETHPRHPASTSWTWNDMSRLAACPQLSSSHGKNASVQTQCPRNRRMTSSSQALVGFTSSIAA